MKMIRETRKEYCENKMEEELDSVDSFEKSSKRKKRKLQDITDAPDPRKTRMTIEFNDRESASIKSSAVKKRNEVKVTTCFMSGKLLMFAKLSLKSFICDRVETLCFPKENIKAVYNKYKIEKFEIFHLLADTDSTSLMFIFMSNQNSDIQEDKFRDIIFEVIIASEIYKRFDLSHEFWSIFDARKEQKRKKLGY